MPKNNKSVEIVDENDMNDFFDTEMDDDMLPEMFGMIIESQKTAVSLTTLVLEHSKKENLNEQTIYEIYQRSFQQVLSTFEKGLAH